MVPVALSIAAGLGVDPKPLLMGVAFAASMSFMTPIGYQTNTMVLGPGGYRFSDYLKAGAPMNLMLWAIASLLIPRLWPF
jgi:di/tricarboxylate transporter